MLVFDLGGGTLDLAVVEYGPAGVTVKATGGDPELGGVDFTAAVADALAGQFARELHSQDGRDLGDAADPRSDPVSEQALLNEAEEVKRSLSVREATQIQIVHAGRRKSYKVERDQLEALTAHLVTRAEGLVKRPDPGTLERVGVEIDAVLLTGGSRPASRWSGRCCGGWRGRPRCTELSPDLSVAHGACLYAGLLAQDATVARTNLLGTTGRTTGEWRGKLVHRRPEAPRTGRGLGVLVRKDRTRRANENRTI